MTVNAVGVANAHAVDRVAISTYMQQAGSVPAELYGLCFQSGSTPALIVDRTSLCICEANQAFLNLIQAESVTGFSLDSLFDFDEAIHKLPLHHTGRLKAQALPCHFYTKPLGADFILLEAVPMKQEEGEEYAHFKQLNERKNELIANISHELRTPLTAILGWPEIILDSGDMPGLAVQAAQAIRKDGSFLRELLEDLIDISKIDSGKLKLIREDENLNQIVQDAHDILVEQAQQKEQQLHLHLPDDLVWAHVDRIRIMQIVINYLSNAIKYTPQGGIIELHLERIGDEAQIRVQDNGIGIDPDLQEQVFERYVRADEVKTKRGVGIGLALVRKLAQLHAGRCWVQSEKGGGSCFYLALPALDIERKIAPPSLPEPNYAPLKDLSLLILTTDPAESLLLERLLEHHVGGIEAHSLWSDRPWPETDLCLAVASLEQLDTQSFQKLRRELHCPIIALTASAMKGDRERFLELGYQAVLSKPFSKQDLLQCIQQIWTEQLHV